ncbi:glucanase B [Lecanosticta acicola]|uniref:Glucanase B n=1 Tax=Lecanosticta acicola TaxID=111012 RepID=A0AAI8Z2J0_9PEZI|nr:glucanase B [Lecanosticta acicola]
MSLLSLLFASLSLFSYTANAVPITVHPGGVQDLIVTHNNTINATNSAFAVKPDSQPASYLNLALLNYMDSNNVKSYITGLNANNQLVFLGPNGQFYYPSTTSGTPVPLSDSDIAIPLGGKGSTTSATIPGYLSASRVWFSDGPLQFFVVGTPNGPGLVEPAAVNPNDPNAATNYGFAELTWNSANIFADISFVDFVGLPLGIRLTTNDGTAQQEAQGLPSNAVQLVCSDLQKQHSSDGMPWDQECVYSSNGQLIRVLAPIDYLSQNSNAWSGYFDNYIREVYQQYSSSPLTIDTQAAAGNVNCYADMGSMTLHCDGDNRGYPAPSAADIFGCNSGPFGFQSGDNDVHYAIVPRLCAAFNRGTLLNGGGNIQPSAAPNTYYTSSQGVWNHFSQSVHRHESNGLGYAFSYDDVSPSDAQNVAGVVQSAKPNTLSFLVGGFDLA